MCIRDRHYCCECHTEFSFYHWQSSAVLLPSDSFLAVGFLIARNSSTALGTESQVIRTLSLQEDESPAKTPILLESCRLCRVLMTYTPVSYTHLDVYKRQGFGREICLPGDLMFGSLSPKSQRTIRKSTARNE